MIDSVGKLERAASQLTNTLNSSLGTHYKLSDQWSVKTFQGNCLIVGMIVWML